MFDIDIPPFEFSVEIKSFWKWNWAATETVTVQEFKDHVTNDDFPQMFTRWAEHTVTYTSNNKGQAPVLTLDADVSSWRVGDEILVAATAFDPKESETFTIVECPECANNQVKVDRSPTHTHWGRIDPRTRIDQRAEVALLSRNVRFYGEMSRFIILSFERYSYI